MPVKIILLIEDNLDSCNYLARLLELKGYVVRKASDGLEALKEITEFPPDLLISDIMMPKLDGIKLVTILRHTVKYRNIPIIMLSAFGSGNLQAAMKAGADKAMRKPLNFDLFFKSIETLMP